MLIRKRFLNIFLYDMKKILEARAIIARNKAMHSSDAVTNTNLFEFGRRNNDSLMVKIYDLSYY
jgi:hypothetical protein